MYTNWICYWSISAKSTLPNSIEHKLRSHMMFWSIDSNKITANVYQLNLLLIDNCGRYTRKQHRAYVAHDVLAFSSIFTCRMVDNCGNSVYIQHIKYLSDSLQWCRLTNNTSPTTFWLEEIDPLERCDFQIVMDWKPPIPYERTVRINNPNNPLPPVRSEKYYKSH